MALNGPKKLKAGAAASYGFGSTEAGSTFECNVDKAAPKPCSSPFKLKTKGLKPGKHTLTVAAVDAAGNADPTPATIDVKLKKKKKGKKKG